MFQKNDSDKKLNISPPVLCAFQPSPKIKMLTFKTVMDTESDNNYSEIGIQMVSMKCCLVVLRWERRNFFLTQITLVSGTYIPRSLEERLVV